MSDRQLAGYLGLAVETLWVKRHYGLAPKCHGRGKGTLTHIKDADEWVRNRGKIKARKNS